MMSGHHQRTTTNELQNRVYRIVLQKNSRAELDFPKAGL